MRFYLLLSLFILTVFGASSQQTKYALVVGNADYQYLESLKNPLNDAQDMGALLTKMGFVVDEYTDVSKVDFMTAIKAFVKKARNFDVVLFYYAGHGLELGGKNYFVPVDALATNLGEVKKSCVSANAIIYPIKSLKSDANIIILDACRNNPFPLISSSEVGEGLALMDAPPGTLLAFSTAPGKVASDGTGRNGLYTDALLTHMGSFDLELKEMFAQVRNQVVRKTNERQVPWESTSLTQQVVLRPKPELPLELTILEGDSVTFEGKGGLNAVSNLNGVAFNWYHNGKQFTNGASITVNKSGEYQLKAVSRQGQIILSDPIYVQIKSFVNPQPYILEGESITFKEQGVIHGRSNVSGDYQWVKGNNVIEKGPELSISVPGIYKFKVVTREGEEATSKSINVRIK